MRKKSFRGDKVVNAMPRAKNAGRKSKTGCYIAHPQKLKFKSFVCVLKSGGKLVFKGRVRRQRKVKSPNGREVGDSVKTPVLARSNTIYGNGETRRAEAKRHWKGNMREREMGLRGGYQRVHRKYDEG